MRCRFCGTHIEEGGKKCPLCGASVEGEFSESSQKSSEKNTPIAIAAFVCGLASAIFCVLTHILFRYVYFYSYAVFSALHPAFAISGIVCGAIALAKQKPTRTFAVTGVIVGCIVMILKFIAMFVLIAYSMRSC